MKRYNLRCIKKILKSKGLTLATAESCTGGELSSSLTSIGGSSDYFVLGMVVYDTLMKIEVLGVPKRVIEESGVYSTDTAFHMAKNVKNISGASIGISTTGEFNGEGYLYYCIYLSDDFFKLGKIDVYGDRVESKHIATKKLHMEILKFITALEFNDYAGRFLPS